LQRSCGTKDAQALQNALESHRAQKALFTVHRMVIQMQMIQPETQKTQARTRQWHWPRKDCSISTRKFSPRTCSTIELIVRISPEDQQCTQETPVPQPGEGRKPKRKRPKGVGRSMRLSSGRYVLGGQIKLNILILTIFRRDSVAHHHLSQKEM